jgi:hypothetical protein
MAGARKYKPGDIIRGNEFLCYTGVKGQNSQCIVRCITCGTEREIQTSNLKALKGCKGCYVNPNPNRGLISAIHVAISSYKNGATHRGYEYTLSEQDFINITTQPCFYCGAPPSLRTTPQHNYEEKDVFIHSGIDRVNNKIGYIVSNCVPCCSTCNRAKRAMTREEFEGWLDQLVNYRINLAN